jgi:cytochrome c nitrite reductase small subunit
MGSRDAERNNKAALPRLAIPLLAVLVGIALGLGLFTLNHAEGLSYLSTDPAACANCHIMQSQYDSWQKSSHHTVAKCVDCHLPHDFIGKYVAKAENGWHHSKGFTLQDFHEPIMIKSKNALILQRNCLACHGEIAHGLVEGVNGEPDDVQCVHCHIGVGHGETTGLGGPEREEEVEAARRAAADASQGKNT